jgi:hypothetical protein
MRRKMLAVLAIVGSAVGLMVAAGPAFAAPSFNVSGHTTFDRTYTWAVNKTAHNPSLVLAVGQSFNEAYDVTVTNTGYVDSNWKVQDGIHYFGTSFTPVSLTAVIQPGDIAATVVCPAGKLGNTITDLNCTYSADLPDGAARTTVATLTFADGSTAVQSFAFDFTADLLPGQPVEFKKCVNASDSYAGALGTVCVADSPKTFSYTRTIGPYATCGEYTVENTASLDDDPIHPATSSATVHVTVPCVGGCTRTIGYWKTHAGFGPQADVVTQYLPRYLGTVGGTKTQFVGTAAKAVQFLSFGGSNNVFDASNGINKLYAQLLAAKLNIASGANGSAVASTISAADAFLAGKDSLNWAGLSKANKNTVLGWMTRLDGYNNGLSGPGHCSED